MNTRHTPSLELCQELDRLCKEKNITLPETEFYWKVGKASGHANLTTDKPDLENWTKTDDGFDWYHAPLVSEQGEWFPEYLMIRGKRYLPKQQQVGVRRYYSYEYDEFNLIIQGGKGEPNARQKMINYLIAEGIITTL